MVFLKRFGRGSRAPTRDILLLRAIAFVGHSKGLGIHEFLDEVSAILGLMFVGSMLFSMGLGYNTALLSLFVPAAHSPFLLFLTKKYHRIYIGQGER